MGKFMAYLTWRSLVTSTYVVMRTDVLEDLGLLGESTEYDDLD